SIYIPDSIERINQYAFFNCKLESLYIPYSIKYVGVYAFMGNPITEVEFANNSKIEELGRGAFYFLDQDINYVVKLPFKKVPLISNNYSTFNNSAIVLVKDELVDEYIESVSQSPYSYFYSLDGVVTSTNDWLYYIYNDEISLLKYIGKQSELVSIPEFIGG